MGNRCKSSLLILLFSRSVPLLTSEGVHVSVVVRCDGVQVDTAATLSILMDVLVTGVV